MFKYYGIDFKDASDVKDIINIGLILSSIGSMKYYMDNNLDPDDFSFENLIDNEDLLNILTLNTLELYDNDFKDINNTLSREELIKFFKANIVLLSSIDGVILENTAEQYENTYKLIRDFIPKINLVDSDKYLFFDEDTYINVHKITTDKDIYKYGEYIYGLLESLGAESFSVEYLEDELEDVLNNSGYVNQIDEENFKYLNLDYKLDTENYDIINNKLFIKEPRFERGDEVYIKNLEFVGYDNKVFLKDVGLSSICNIPVGYRWSSDNRIPYNEFSKGETFIIYDKYEVDNDDGTYFYLYGIINGENFFIANVRGIELVSNSTLEHLKTLKESGKLEIIRNTDIKEGDLYYIYFDKDNLSAKNQFLYKELSKSNFFPGDLVEVYRKNVIKVEDTSEITLKGDYLCEIEFLKHGEDKNIVLKFEDELGEPLYFLRSKKIM